MSRKKQKPETGKKKKINIPIVLVGFGFSAVFLSMMTYITKYSLTHRQELINNSYNGRQEILIAQNIRGTIYSSDGDILAETITDSEGTEQRVYPYGNLFAHSIGYASNGRAGVEAQGNYYLINSNAPLSEKASNEFEGVKYQGDSIYTTLDVTLQEIAAKALGVYKGAVIVSEPSTGKILAMVSKPDYDPNQIDAIWAELLEDQESGMLLNRVTQGIYPPGSTFKIITTLQYIKENPDTYQQYHYQCNGSYRSGEDRINCYHGQSHGQEDFAKAFAKSCNSAFADIGLSLNKEKFRKTLDDLLFDQDLSIGLTSNQSRVEVSGDTDQTDMMQVSIGQGTTGMTPIHLNLITNAIANDGTVMKPYIMDRVENSTGTVVKQFSPSVYKKMLSSSEAQGLKVLMQGVVEQGTGRKLQGLSYTAAGKTGSAEYNSVKEDSHAWFTGFAPVEDPQISLTIIIEGAGSGGDFAVPIAKRIFDAYFGV